MFPLYLTATTESSRGQEEGMVPVGSVDVLRIRLCSAYVSRFLPLVTRLLPGKKEITRSPEPVVVRGATTEAVRVTPSYPSLSLSNKAAPFQKPRAGPASSIQSRWQSSSETRRRGGGSASRLFGRRRHIQSTPSKHVYDSRREIARNTSQQAQFKEHGARVAHLTRGIASCLVEYRE